MPGEKAANMEPLEHSAAGAKPLQLSVGLCPTVNKHISIRITCCFVTHVGGDSTGTVRNYEQIKAGTTGDVLGTVPIQKGIKKARLVKSGLVLSH